MLNSLEQPVKYIRSFVRRQGRITPGQDQAIARYWGQYGVEAQKSVLDFKQLFHREAPIVLEIGFGMGESLLQMAKDNPDTCYLGVEVYRPGIGKLLTGITQHGIDTIRICCVDVIDVLHYMIAENSLQGVQTYFPDPWPKQRHKKRRLIQTGFIDLVVSRLKPHGYIHLATDCEDYAAHMLSVLEAHSELRNSVDHDFLQTRIRPVTKYEKRARRLGHSVWDLLFIKNHP